MSRVTTALLWPITGLRKAITSLTLGTSILLSIAMLSSLSSVAFLTSTAFASFVSGGLARIGITTVYQASALKADRLAKQNRLLTTQNSKLLKQRQALGKTVKSTRKVILERARKNVVRNVGAMPAEAIPIAGIAVVISVTALEVNDMCAIVEDIDNLMVSLDIEQTRSESEAMCLSWRKALKENTEIVNQGMSDLENVFSGTG